jgi:pyruvate dehydrogenase E2 component (dihydrolipoamide acetyltransferase)
MTAKLVAVWLMMRSSVLTSIQRNPMRQKHRGGSRQHEHQSNGLPTKEYSQEHQQRSEKVSQQAVLVPDIGSDNADVIEILVKPGDIVGLEQAIVVLESAKASMEVPCSFSGRVTDIAVAVGQSVKEGDLLLHVETSVNASLENTTTALTHKDIQDVPVKEIQAELESVSHVLAPPADTAAPKAVQTITLQTSAQIVKAPDIGSESAEIIEILVKVGDVLALDQPIMVLESAKASMELPSSAAGVVQKILVKVGDTISESIALLEVLAEAPARAATTEMLASLAEAASSPADNALPVNAVSTHASLDNNNAVVAQRLVPLAGSTLRALAHAVSEGNQHRVHAGPAVRRLARELGVDLAKVQATGPKQRLLKEDVHAFVKSSLTEKPAVAAHTGAGIVPSLPVIDFAKWGPVERIELSKIQKLSAKNLHRAWVTIPHVTQFDEADITELDAFRLAQKDALKAEGVSLTMLSFMVKASAHLLKRFPKFASSLAVDGEYIVQKQYVHIGVAVDTPSGLVVPVIRDADKKSIREIARDMAELSLKARDKKLTPADMQGACFSISSLGGIGGTAFTPIVNWPEVAILGVSRAAIKPVWDGQAFQPRLMLPLSLSYDHRVIDGADAARFTSALTKTLADIRQILL